MRYIVQGHHEIFHWCLELEVELAKKRYSQHIQRQQVPLSDLS